MDLGVSGLASGFDWRTLVDQLADVERAPERRLRSEQTAIQQRNQAFSSIKTQLGVLQNKIKVIKESSLFDARTLSTSNSSIASGTASPGAATGSFRISITRLASAAVLQGAADIGAKLSSGNDVATLLIQEAPVSNAITAGTFTVNGRQVEVRATDTLQEVFDKISSATDGAVTAAYDSVTDHVKLSSAGEIVLGSATDSSNFLNAMKLGNNGTGQVASTSSLGSVRLAKTLAGANLRTPVTDGGAGAGEFKVNGVSIRYDASKDSLSDVLSRVTSSAAGVTASYDTVNDRILLANKATGDVGVAVQDITGNFAAAIGLTTGALQRGLDLQYSVNGGGVCTSRSNTITEASSGISGLSVTALTEGTVTLNVATDATKIKAAINDFITEYNKAQSIISTNTASTTDSAGKVTAGILAADSDAATISAGLRRVLTRDASGLSAGIARLASLGFKTNGNDDSIATDDTAMLDTAIETNLSGLRSFFTDKDHGLGAAVDGFINQIIGENGTLIKHQGKLTAQSSSIDTQVNDMERLVLSNRQRMIDSFVSMETAQQQFNTQLKFLQQRFGT